jgi:DNA-binding transcriptional MerR regulator
MRTGDLTKKFGVSEATIRRWASDFSEYLSEQPGRHRNYTESDYIVVATIHELFSTGLNQKTVMERLASGYRVDADNIGEIGYVDGRMVPAAVVQQVIDSSQLRTELDQVKYERDRLLQMLERSEKQRDELQHELTEKVEKLQKEISNLQRELGRAEGRAEIYKEERNRKINGDTSDS